jgi:hypothetical protein
MPPVLQLLDLFKKHAGSATELELTSYYTIPDTPLIISKIRMERGTLVLIAPNNDERPLTGFKGAFLNKVLNGLFHLLWSNKPQNF